MVGGVVETGNYSFPIFFTVVSLRTLVITHTVNLYKRTPLTVFGNEYFPCYFIFFWTIFGALFDGDSNFFSQTYQTKWWA